ncbi:MAG TPA: bifunctional UDP-N-acetylglucosamine diphosphorylase/glucosamine-1-phosphate N-acetyltransferase GlmU [Bacillota bacterium]|jgi:bifunctional UDP-N-acetylglucosamine pyrophosphorylase/glucosamine-1-phosphate N-acetyltransferase|nr:bifunctional UDP-N-acetylglucosamine diphosphorylase/glucosamine-1-phosphate N-acetyltransferase GlmU [Bacillota bacterium]HOL09954.1 bifunctional UDP-N-acetylglucosamine diphosphorylase/glucosamine-1-phosphate N-acetyltransferase GlmU [Bacillota bacterium]HPO97952.1 bifunctional UDP-N-acetylglucosamine diphosphorylase/glucosamine-1-phosphate N-acetyltransferase GlmU [Bacillota bacterium]
MACLASLVLAAGQGTRMKSRHPKVLHHLLGKPMLKYVINAAQAAGAEPVIIVVGFEGQKVIDTIGTGHQYVWQKEQLGTGHAVMMAREKLADMAGEVLVLYGDTPLLKPETLKQLVTIKRSQNVAATILTTTMNDPKGYGRIVRNTEGNIVAIIEEKDANPEQKAINEVNTGVYCFDIQALLAALDRLTPNNAQGEYYLTDVFEIFVSQGLKVAGMLLEDSQEVMGPNDRIQLAKTEEYLKMAINERLMAEGVTIVDPKFTYIDPEVTIGRDTIILPGTFINGKTTIGENCVIGPHTRIVNSVIGAGTEIQFSQIIEAQIGIDNSIGPFAYIRPGTISEANVKFGDFVEIKNCSIGAGSKVPHLTYLGDTELGKDVNIGAGTITCNYDGVNKHKTIIKDNSFIGSNSNLVAPVTIGSNVTIAAGSTITKDVPDGSLGIARSRQEVRMNWKSPRQKQEQE